MGEEKVRDEKMRDEKMRDEKMRDGEVGEEKMRDEKTLEEKTLEEKILDGNTMEEKTGGKETREARLRLPALLAGYFVLLFILLCLEVGERGIFWIGRMFVAPDVLFVILLFLTAILWISGTGGSFLRGWQIALGLGKEKGYSLTELRRDMEAVRFARMTIFAISGIIVMVNLVNMLYFMDDIATFGESLADSFLSIFYAFALMLFQLPVEGRLRDLLTGYMEGVDGDEEPVEDEQTLYFRLRGMGLTDREAEVARLVAREMSNKDIGKELYISDGTVKKHITHILEKTGCNGREGLAEMVRSRKN